LNLLEVALAYARDELPVVPLHTPDAVGSCSCGRDCGSPGKHPRTLHGLKDATTDTTRVGRWWSWWPDANIGIRTGTPGGIVVVDTDSPAAELRLHELAGRDPGGLIVETGRGHHRWYRTPEGVTIRNSQGAFGLGLDVKGDGGYVAGPPSLHHSGCRYRFAGGDLEPLPARLLRLLAPPPRTAPAWSRPQQRTVMARGRTTPYGRLVLDRTWGYVRWATEGKRHPALFRGAYTLGGYIASGHVDEAEAEETLLEAATLAGLEDGRAELLRQIRRAFYGYNRPDGTSRPGGVDDPLEPPPSRLQRLVRAESEEEQARVLEETLRDA
jgi:hypothetical protein